MISKCIFTQNAVTTAGSAGGGALQNSGSGVLVVNTCSFTKNTAGLFGGAYFGYGNGSTFTNCFFSGNSVGTGGWGGGVFTWYNAESANFINCAFINNNANGGYGGGIAFDASGSGLLKVTNCSFYNNTAAYGGAITIYATASAIINNSIIWGNSSGIYLYSTTTVPTITYTDIQKDGSFTTLPSGTGNFSKDPLFTSSSNLQLTSSSPALNAGLNGYNSTSVDLAGNSRIVNNNY